ncbi:hypothetical protein L7F22_026179 [Adiantum nelumboides]|nr:hypothetical protein [Adiantum nelumboides]
MQRRPKGSKIVVVRKMPRSKHANVNIGTYLFCTDLPPFDNDDDLEHINKLGNTDQSVEGNIFHEEFGFRLGFSSKYAKKRRRRGSSLQKHHQCKATSNANDNCTAFIIAIDTRSSMDADANLKDISIDRFSVSVQEKELLKSASFKITYGRRYGLVGPNGKGKSPLLKLLA